MTYLGVYHRSNRLMGDRKDLCSEASYDLNDEFRYGIDLPDMHEVSLNVCWPPIQGVSGGMTRLDSSVRPQKIKRNTMSNANPAALKCGNPGCSAPKASTSSLPPWITTGRFISSIGPFAT
jgi:hypothetical protein